MEFVIRVISDNMQITVDRIENGVIVFVTQEGKTFTVSQDVFPTLSEGDIISAGVDTLATDIKKQEFNTRLQNLFNK